MTPVIETILDEAFGFLIDAIISKNQNSKSNCAESADAKYKEASRFIYGLNGKKNYLRMTRLMADGKGIDGNILQIIIGGNAANMLAFKHEMAGSGRNFGRFDEIETIEVLAQKEKATYTPLNAYFLEVAAAGRIDLIVKALDYVRSKYPPPLSGIAAKQHALMA